MLFTLLVAVVVGVFFGLGARNLIKDIIEQFHTVCLAVCGCVCQRSGGLVVRYRLHAHF